MRQNSNLKQVLLSFHFTLCDLGTSTMKQHTAIVSLISLHKQSHIGHTENTSYHLIYTIKLSPLLHIVNSQDNNGMLRNSL